MSHFNLIDEAWIPIRLPDGSRTELGIRDTLFRSKEIAAIEDPSPLVVAALHRFLLALLYRALAGPTSREEARTLFRQGLPDGQIAAYLDKWKERFWLFHEKWPFGQNSLIPADFQEPWNRLTAESNPTKNKILFDHTNTIVLEERLANECVRWILATMSFSIAGGRGYFPSPSANGRDVYSIGKESPADLVLFPGTSKSRGSSVRSSPLGTRPQTIAPPDAETCRLGLGRSLYMAIQNDLPQANSFGTRV